MAPPRRRTLPTDLRSLAERITAAATTHPEAVAALVAGSVASGTADEWSDVDLILFYDAWPGAEAIAAVRASLDPSDHVVLGGDADGDVYLEQFRVDGVACQLVHQTIDAWRASAATVLVDLDTSSPTQKALGGLHAGVVLHGDAVIAQLRGEAAYPSALRSAMVRDHRDVFPLWRLRGMGSRDAELWQRGQLVAGFENVLGMLAGVNEVYFSTFQLKHTRALVSSFRVAPPDLVDRMERALVAPMHEAVLELERVVDETSAIVREALPRLNSD